MTVQMWCLSGTLEGKRDGSEETSETQMILGVWVIAAHHRELTVVRGNVRWQRRKLENRVSVHGSCLHNL